VNKETPGVTPCESHVCREVLDGHSLVNVPLRDHNGHKLYEYPEYGEKPCKCKEHVETFHSPHCLDKNERTHIGEKPMNVRNVIKPSDISVVLKIIKGFTLAINTMNISNAGKASGDMVPLRLPRPAWVCCVNLTKSDRE
jgi:hypothetical protein